jgi:acyl-coenzyme A thioesterase PaaI-like protein
MARPEARTGETTPKNPVEDDMGEGPDRSRFITHWQASAMPASGAWASKRRLAAAMRVVIERLVTSDAPEDELSAAADALEQYAERLATHPRLNRYEGFAETANAGDVGAFFDQSPLIGLANPLAPPMQLRAENQRIVGMARFGSAYEGPPGCVHGGCVAAAFDELLGFAQSLTGNPGMTGTLTVRYRRPTPLHTDLRFEARVVRVEGRKIFTEGHAYAGDMLTAEADGIFLSIDRARFEALERARKAGSDDR